MKAIYKKNGAEMELTQNADGSWNAKDYAGSIFKIADSTKKRWFKVLKEQPAETKVEEPPTNELGEEVSFETKTDEAETVEHEDLSPNGIDGDQFKEPEKIERKRVTISFPTKKASEDSVGLITADEITAEGRKTRTWLMVFEMPDKSELHVIDRAFGTTKTGKPDHSTSEAFICRGEIKSNVSFGIKKTVEAWCTENEGYLIDALLADIKALRQEYFKEVM